MADINHGGADFMSERVNLRTKRIDLRFKGTDLRPEQAAHEQYVVSNNHLPTLQDYDLNFERVGHWLRSGIMPRRTH